MLMTDQIRQKLELAFSPTQLQVTDESHLHHGHAGARDGGDSHFRVYCVSSLFDGKSRVERHRLVNAALADELKQKIHALALDLKSADEA